MKSIHDENLLFEKLFDLLEKQFGSELEVVLHDLTGNLCHSIVSIRNGHVTNRSVGDMEERHGIVMSPGTHTDDGSIFGEIVYTKDSRILRCSTFKIIGDNGSIIGSICVNQDITKEVQFSDYLRKHNGMNLEADFNRYPKVSTLLSRLMNEALLKTGKHYDNMTKADKLTYIKYLDERGAFLVSKSGPKVCKALDISKFTLYSYLDKIRGKDDDKPLDDYSSEA